MKYIVFTLALTPMLLLADSRTDTLDRISSAQNVFHEIMNSPNGGIPQDILSHAQCVGIIPGLKKGAFIFGAKYGKGILVCRTNNGWSAPDTVIAEGGSVGFQIGGSDSDVVLVVQNQGGENALMRDKFTLNANGGVAAGPVGRSLSGETDAELHAEILTYARSRGAFAGVDLGGATLRPDHEDNRALYGRNVTPREILTGQVPPPPGIGGLYAELNRYAGSGRTGISARR